MLGRPTVLLLVLVLAAGCIAAPENVETASSAPDADASGAPLAQAPRAVQMPAGSSFVVVRMDVAESDWTSSEGGASVRIGHDFPDGLESEGYSALYFQEDGMTLDPRGSFYGSGGGAGSTGSSGDPEAFTVVIALTVVNASEPFELRFGAFDAFPDFELEGEAVPATVLAQGADAALSSYTEFGTPFDLVFPSGPWTSGMTVEDTRVHPPVGASTAAAAGALDLSYAHALASPGIHQLLFVAMDFNGARAGAWSFEAAVGDGSESAGGPYAGPIRPFGVLIGDTPGAASARFRLDAVAEVFPLTIFHATSIGWDPAADGYALEPYFATAPTLPVAVQFPGGGCVRADAPAPPTLAACALSS